MNTIKFSPISDDGKETNNVEVYEVKDIILDGKKYKYYSNAQISLYVTKKCNGRCWFCMNRFEDRYCNSRELTDEDYFYNLDHLLDTFKDIKPPITITGGEPTKSNRLVPTIRKIKEKGFHTRTFATNGTGLFDYYEGKIIIAHLVENGIVNNINISRMVIDDEKNKKIMGIEINNDDIRKIYLFGHINEMDIRLSCNIQKGGVENLDDILKYHDFYDSIGADTVMFRELIPFCNEKRYTSKVISIEPIFEEIEKNPSFEHLRTIDGMYYIVKVYRYKDKVVKCYKEKKNLGVEIDKNIIREFVLYPDGNLDGGWNKDNNIILKRERRKYNE